ncbi:hypothetical protein C4D60_Mb05t03310 [Musa balbisiana]|uniref:Uncharacterized protein n=1 Tax=Musa balbisiana TaxID=52838 RepID=A0A4S8JTD1_MUSBA|nr:hypothetical protein C4D60_Mb05t03310 [Musa balbisiana]
MSLQELMSQGADHGIKGAAAVRKLMTNASRDQEHAAAATSNDEWEKTLPIVPKQGGVRAHGMLNRNYTTGEVVHTEEAVTDKAGTYQVAVLDDHQEDTCEMILVNGPLVDFSEISAPLSSPLTTSGSPATCAKDKPLASCGQLLMQNALAVGNSRLILTPKKRTYCLDLIGHNELIFCACNIQTHIICAFSWLVPHLTDFSLETDAGPMVGSYGCVMRTRLEPGFSVHTSRRVIFAIPMYGQQPLGERIAGSSPGVSLNLARSDRSCRK